MPTPDPKALVLCLSDPNGDPRPNRVVSWLADSFRVTVAALAPPDDRRIKFVDLGPDAIPGRNSAVDYVRHAAGLWLNHRVGRPQAMEWTRAMRRCAAALEGQRFELIVCFDLGLLPLAGALKGGAKLIFDAREFYPRQFEDRPVWKACFQPHARHLCRTYLKSCDRIYTVSPGLQDGYRAEFGVETELFLSLPAYQDLQPQPVDASAIRLIYHGNANPSRSTDRMIELMRRLDDRFQMDFMVLPTGGRYVEGLKRQAAELPRVRFVPPQPFENIVPFINAYDIGVFYVPPRNFNLKHCLPNKFFEFIQARLAVAVGPSPDMADFLGTHDLGVSADDWNLDGMADCLNALSADCIYAYKQRSHAVAERFSANASRDQFMATVNGLLVG